MNWSAYFIGGQADLTKRALRPAHPPAVFEFAVLEPVRVFDPNEEVVMPKRDVYFLRYADERTRTAIYIYDRRV